MNLLLHPSTRLALDAIIRRPARSYLFYGANGVGKKHSAISLATRLNCANGASGDDCSSCVQIASGNYPDLLLVQSETKIGIAQILDLQKKLDLAPYLSTGRRMVIIDGGGGITTEAQNCLLKTLEEPPAGSIVVLINASRDGLLPTVLSRLQTLNFPLLGSKEIAEHLTPSYGSQIANAAANLCLGRAYTAELLARDKSLLLKTQENEGIASELVASSTYNRLRLIANSDPQTPWREIMGFLVHNARQSVRQGQPINLAALEKFYRYGASNVNMRSSLEALMLEL